MAFTLQVAIDRCGTVRPDWALLYEAVQYLAGRQFVAAVDAIQTSANQHQRRQHVGQSSRQRRLHHQLDTGLCDYAESICEGT